MIGSEDRHLFIIHRYFWPQNYPYAIMLKNITETVAKNFDQITVLSTEQESGELFTRRAWADSKNICLKTLKMGSERRRGLFYKLLNMAKYSFWIFLQLLVSKPSVVMVATTPPILIAAIVRWLSYLKGYKYIYHCQDIHPEAMLYNNNIRPGMVYNILINIDKKNIDHAFKVITLSEDMRQSLGRRGCKIDHVHLINNFIFKKSKEAVNVDTTKTTFLFAGNLGRLQNLDILFEALVPFKNFDNVSFNFMGSGALEDKLQKFVKENELHNVHFLGQRSVNEAVKAMRESDFGIVTLSKGITGVAYPSKTMIYLGNGLPILALIDSGTELSRFINDNRLGISVAPTSVKKIVSAIEELISKSNDDCFSKERVTDLADMYFGEKVILNKFLKVIHE